MEYETEAELIMIWAGSEFVSATGRIFSSAIDSKWVMDDRRDRTKVAVAVDRPYC